MSVAGVDAVVDAGLAAFALDRLGGNAPGATLLRSSRLLAQVRHAAIRRAASALIRAWHEVGIDTLLFKGFYLAEFVYPQPSWRAYSDVDVALRSRSGAEPPVLAGLAAAVARDVGFDVKWHLGEPQSVDSFHDPRYNGHELLQLVHADTGTSLDAHRRLVHSNVSLRHQSDKGEILTRSVWEAAQAVEFDGVDVYVPAPIDSALVGLIAARSWSGDRYALRAHDLLDLDMLMRHGGFGRVELVARAQALGLSATTKLFLRRCDPASKVLDLQAPGPVRAFWYDTLLLSERSHRGLAQASAAALATPEQILAVLREFPAAARQVQLVRGGRAPQWRSPAAPPRPRSLDRRTWRASQLGVRRALKLLGMKPELHRELALACLHGSLTRRGFEITKVEDEGRTWFEFEGRELPFDQLGPAMTSRLATGPVRPPRTSRWQRLHAIGWAGVVLRIEATLLLRRILAALSSKTFKTVRAELLQGRSRRDGAAVDSSDTADGTAVGTAVGTPAATPVQVGEGRSIGLAVSSAARFVPGALCVAQALAAQVMLARRHQESTIHFGFLRSPGGTVEGHAWLEVNGSVVVGAGSLDGFTRTATFHA